MHNDEKLQFHYMILLKENTIGLYIIKSCYMSIYIFVFLTFFREMNFNAVL